MMNTENQSDKKIWGRIMWKLFFTIAEYSEYIDIILLSDLIKIIPYIIPCEECQKHTEYIYEIYDFNNIGGSKFEYIIWQLNSEIKKKTHERPLTYNEYKNNLKSNEKISVNEIIKLVDLISRTKIKTKCKTCNGKLKKNDIRTFIDTIIKISKYIPQISGLKNVSHILYMSTYHM